MGKKWDYDVPSIELWKECLRVLKPGGTALIFAGSRTQHRMACNVEDAGFILKDVMLWIFGSGFPKATDISKQLDKGHERKVVGKNPNFRNESGRKGYLGESNFRQTDGMANLTEPSTPEAKLWNGWKSHGLKPSYEPVLVAVKPNDGTYANNALKWGVSGLNIDGGRIGTEKIAVNIDYKEDKQADGWGTKRCKTEMKEQGRFPANLLLSCDCEDDKNHNPDCPVKMLDEQSGVLKSGSKKANQKNYNHKGKEFVAGMGESVNEYQINKGGASRFFYTAKASKSERNAGCEELFILKEKAPEEDIKEIKHLLSV